MPSLLSENMHLDDLPDVIKQDVKKSRFQRFKDSLAHPIGYLRATFSKEIRKDAEYVAAAIMAYKMYATMAEDLCTCLGRTVFGLDDMREEWYETSLAEEKKMRVTYSDQEWADRLLPFVTIELFESRDNEPVLFSRAIPSYLVDPQGMPPMEEYISPFALSSPCQELNPQLATEVMTAHYAKKEAEIKATPRYFFEKRIRAFENIAQNMGSIDPVFHPDLNLSRRNLEHLEGRLLEITSSERPLGIKIHDAERAVQRAREAGVAEEFYAALQEVIEKVMNGHPSEKLLPPPERILFSSSNRVLSRAASGRRPAPPTKRENFKEGSPYSISGPRRDIGISVRSTWEANYARVLLLEGIPFEYESASV